jgi:subtilisin family serine protease
MAGLTDPDATVTVAAPGNYAFYSGTSMATPHVSGVAALVWSQNTDCTNDEIRNALTGTAFDLGDTGRDAAYGYGLVQAFDATNVITDTDPNSIPFCGGGGGGGGGSSGGCELLQKHDSCISDAQCCSGTCKGRSGSQSCK